MATRMDAPSLAPALLRALRERFGPEAVERQLRDLERSADAVDDPGLWLSTALERSFKGTEIEWVERCACGEAESSHLSRFVFWNLLGYRQCRRCEMVFVSPRLGADSVRRIFASDYFGDAGPGHWSDRRAPVFADVERLLRRHGCRSAFDVGSAYGHLLRWLSERGYRVAGCDISPRAVAWGQKHLGVNLIQGVVREVRVEERYDCVTSIDALYYASDPVADLVAMRRLLKPGGVLVLRLRTNRGVARRAKRQGARPIGQAVFPAEHLWAFTPASIVPVLRAAGYSVLEVGAAAYSRTPLSPLHALLVRAGRAGGWTSTPSFNVVAQPDDAGRTPGIHGETSQSESCLRSNQMYDNRLDCMT